MKYVDEFRDPSAVAQLARTIHKDTTRPWAIMEVCGGQTHSIVKHGLDQLLPDCLELIHGPGCPVCVTPVEKIDAAIAIAKQRDVVFCSFGDMLRVPGTELDLLTARSQGADVRVVHSPLDAVALARCNRDREVVFFAVGFETTAPANAMAAVAALAEGMNNFSMLVSHVLVPPALCSILDSADNRVQGFLAAGHVCTVTGTSEYEPIASLYQVPIVVTGFEPVDILQGILLCVRQLEAGRCEVENQYARAVRPAGNDRAQKIMAEVFTRVETGWRGLGSLPASGLALAEAYRAFDAEKKFGITAADTTPPSNCLAGQVLTGRIKPAQCPAFGVGCTPARPLGAPMVSTEGACAAYYNYRRRHEGAPHASI